MRKNECGQAPTSPRNPLARNKPSRLVLGESGQSMVEFAIILPLLLLLTFGTLELAVFLSRQITLTGASFLAARAATVGGRDGTNPSQAASEVLGAYAEDSGQAWLRSIVDGSSGKVSVETVSQDRLVRVTTSKNHEQWSGLVLGGSSAYGNALQPTIGQLGTTISLNRESVKGATGQPVVQRPTALTIEYQADLGMLGDISDSMDMPGIRLGLQTFPGMSGLADAITFQPLQAVAKNPGNRTNSQAAVYASSDNENPQELIKSLDLSIKGIQGARAAFMLSPANNPVALTAIQVLFSTAAGMANNSAKLALKAVEGTIFHASGEAP